MHAGFKGDPAAVAGLRYKDKVREKARKLRLAARAEEEAQKIASGEAQVEQQARLQQKVKNMAWSKSKKLPSKMLPNKAGGAGKKRGRDEIEEEEQDSGDEEMMREATLLRKLKQGKITKEQFRERAGAGWSDSDGEA